MSWRVFVTCFYQQVVDIARSLPYDIWVAALEQTMLYLLILGRWFLPRGQLTHDQLSQLLFVFIGMASDIMELFTLFAVGKVRQTEYIGYVILGVWSLSLLQFTFVLTATSSRHKRVVTHDVTEPTEADEDGDEEEEIGSVSLCMRTEIWALMISMFLQDIPFLAVRLYVGIHLEVFTFDLLFFTMKNILVIVLQLYRLVVVIGSNANSEQ